MKYFLTIIFLITSLTYSQHQTKYLVFFKDKGITKGSPLFKTSEEYKRALEEISQRSIERRKKILGNDLVNYDDIPLKEEYVRSIESTGAKIVWELKWFNALSCWATSDQLIKIQKFSFVDKIEKVKIFRYGKSEKNEIRLQKNQVNSDSTYNLDYGMSFTQNELSDIPTVHDLGYSGQNVLIGLLDAGFAWKDHPSLSNANVLAERDFVYGDSSADDGDASHGTAVFSIIGGFHEGWLVGPAYSAQYILAKTEDIRTETRVEEDNFAAALEWMEALGVDITSSSVGYSEFDDSLESYEYKDMNGKTTIVTKAAEFAFSKGVLTITSAGNEGDDPWKHITAPADGFNTLAIGAVNSSNNIAAFSSFGPTFDGRIKPDVLTQGVSCFAARAYSEGYSSGSGTSYSAPIASGIAAQLLSAYPHLQNMQIRRTIIESGDNAENPDTTDYRRGYGLISAIKVLEYPNLEDKNGRYLINKMFIKNEINENDSVFIEINEEGSDVINVLMQKENDKYYGTLPDYPDSTLLQMSFSIVDIGGHEIYREGTFRLVYGSLNIFRYTLPDSPTEPSEKSKFYLSNSYPNPFITSFHPIVTFEVEVLESGNAELMIFNILGQKVKEIPFYVFEGKNVITWNGINDLGVRVASGVYIYKFSLRDKIAMKKMLLLN